MTKKLIERKFWGSSENSEDDHLQKILRMTILRKFWGSSENSEDDDPQKILRILRKFWGWRSSENSEDEDPQKILSIRIFRKFWGWRSSENSEDSLDFFDNHQKFRLMTIPIIIGYIRCSSARRSLQKKISKSKVKHEARPYCVHRQHAVCFTCFVVFPWPSKLYLF